MTVTSNTAIRQTPAAGAPRTTSSPQPAKFDAGSFSRAADSAKSAPVDQQSKDERRIQQRAPGLANAAQQANAMPNMGERLKAVRELKFLESACKQRMHPGQLASFSLFGQSASLSIGSRNEVVLQGKSSPSQNDPGGVITFRNGQISRARTEFGLPMTPKQQGDLISAAYNRIAMGLLNKH